jgi:periplasmic protein TonB
MAQGKAFGASLGFHAAALAAVVIVPLFGQELPPQLRPAPVADTWPDLVPVTLARPPKVPHAHRAPARDAAASLAISEPAAATSLTAVADAPLLDAPPVSDAEWSGLVADGEVDQAGGVAGDVPNASGPRDTRGPLRIGGGLEPPTKLVHVPPEYPELARAARVRGTVVLDCTIDPAGSVVDVRVLSGHPLLDPAAVDAVRRWRYTPTRLNGVPVAVLLTVNVRFDLSR